MFWGKYNRIRTNGVKSRACLASGMDASLALWSAIDELTPKSLLVYWESDRITVGGIVRKSDLQGEA